MVPDKITYKTCSRCKRTLPIAKFGKHKITKDGFRCECKACSKLARTYAKCIDCGHTKRIESKGRCRACNWAWIKKTDKSRYADLILSARQRSKKTDYRKLKSCASFLGVHVAERVLRKVFKDVEMMPLNNPGYDFICNHGKKIDVKSACVAKNKNGWAFSTKKNIHADYFLCIAFDNRQSLTPMHLWLLPSHHVKNISKAYISPKTIHKWDQFELDISKTITCCNTIRN